MNPSLTMDRVVTADVRAVWRAWTTTAGLATWWWHTWPDTRYQADADEGGSYRIEAAEHSVGVRGTYLAVDEPRRLSFSWVWYELREGVAVEEPADQVEVTFTPEAGGTRVRVVHTGPWTSEQSAENYRQGWSFVLDGLTRASAG